MRRLLALLLLPLVAVGPMSAQSDLWLDGEPLAHGVERTGSMPPALRELTRGRSLAFRPSSKRQSSSQARLVRRSLEGNSAHIQPVAPLLSSIRDQEAPYNLLCPRWTYDDGTVSEERCLSGCVATCIEQIMAYYRYPEALLDTLHGWKTDNYIIDDLMPGTRFDWDNYLLDYRQGWNEAQGSAIALVSLACGMAVRMNYGLHSSGANTYNAVEPLKRAFGYGMVRCTDRVFYTPERWHALIQNELRSGRPVAYTGHNMELSGHAFNIDGVDARGYYHVNWGYNGNYDGWYDLDWLTPWEPYDDDTTGVPEGFFCNQSLLMMHPSPDVEPLALDTMSLDALGVQLQDVKFLREPDLQGFVPADFHFLNTSDQTVTYTYEVMTYLPTDTAVFYQADYVGLSALTLQPHESRSQRVYLRFTEKGDRMLGISHDDETIPFTMPVTIGQGKPPRLEWGSATVEVKPTDGGEYEATISVPVANRATSGFAGSLVTLSLAPDGQEEDLRHWWVVDLAGGAEEVRTVTFRHLQPETRYHFLLRCPWVVKAEADFWTSIPVGIDNRASEAGSSVMYPAFDLSGRPAQRSTRGIIIQNGKKWNLR